MSRFYVSRRTVYGYRGSKGTITPENALRSVGKSGTGKYVFNWLSGYTFTNPTKTCNYVKVIKYLMDNGTCSKVELLEDCLGRPAYYIDYHTGEKKRSYGEMCGLFSAMFNSYFIEYTKDHKVRLGVNAIPFMEKEGLI